MNKKEWKEVITFIVNCNFIKTTTGDIINESQRELSDHPLDEAHKKIIGHYVSLVESVSSFKDYREEVLEALIELKPFVSASHTSVRNYKKRLIDLFNDPDKFTEMLESKRGRNTELPYFFAFNGGLI